MNSISFRTRRDAIAGGLGLAATVVATLPAHAQAIDAGAKEVPGASPTNTTTTASCPEGTTRTVEIRSYKLKPGTGARFHDLVTHQSLPLLRAIQMDVVAYGQSLHDPDAYYLIRSYDSPEHRKASQEAFYTSGAWRQGPREAILSLIDADIDTVLCLSVEAVRALRQPQDSDKTS